MRTIIYDALSIGMGLISLLFWYQAVEFLAQKDYVAGVLVMCIGFIVVRGGVEFGRIAVAVREDTR
ncbi:hypothetical protein FRD01_04445 [Microvenator marinus]|jgi:hypothetical protein|uniref:Uncharacterized protein n=1 Tax=Microvenator marinus TaxID=2600177 RepID=A0A5B8XNB7_9DELT|nr:hypothetical protein [Microvenator marinus]QED26508.1 hypothetical protein FRD01_04445 [Microvenator marinus]